MRFELGMAERERLRRGGGRGGCGRGRTGRGCHGRGEAPGGGGGWGTARENAPLPHVGHSWRVGLAAAVLLLAGIVAGWYAGHRSAAAVRFMERRLTANPENDPVFSAGQFHRMASTSPLPAEQESFSARWKREKPIPSRYPTAGRPILSVGFLTAPMCWRRAVRLPQRDPSLWSVSVFGGASRKLMDAAERGAVSPDGSQIVFVRGTTP